MGQFFYVVGACLAIVGGFFALVTTGNVLTFLRLRALERRGVEGEAVSYAHDVMNGKIRVHYRVSLPEGERQGDFYELQVQEPAPVGTVVPVVYDRKRPSRAKTGALEDIDSSSEGWIAKYVTGGGLALLALGIVLGNLFS
ncbi:DUF3592 domain-containing protein [Streptomyces sp. NPDC026092]|uniref:DUF3592 domain-containing protein n=1 Tax=Streptomyces sp. NPDC026092 TaxID=3154797 RepID=UPI0033E5AF23